MPKRPHKSKVAYDLPGHAHFVTFCCQDRHQFLKTDRCCSWLVEAIEEVRKSQNVALWAYVFMPEHVHLLLRPRNPDYRMKDILAAIKRPVSVNAKNWLIETEATEWLRRLTVKKEDKEVFRFWLQGGGYDENVTEPQAVYEIIDYIHANPVRRGLVESILDWKWSSARFWEGMQDVPLKMDPIEF